LHDVVQLGVMMPAPAAEYDAPTYAYLVGDPAKDATGQIFIAAGSFVIRVQPRSLIRNSTACWTAETGTPILEEPPAHRLNP
jgi:hypothetical protein